MAERRLRVTRTLVFEGPEGWIAMTLEKSWLQPDAVTRELDADKSAKETSRVIVDVETGEVVTSPVTPARKD